jgi:hypothetical protein
MRCIFTEEAGKDLETIADYIALDNPARAVSFIQEIRARCSRIPGILMSSGFCRIEHPVPTPATILFKLH